MVMDAIIRVIPSDPVMAHAAEVGVVFLWSRSSALTSPPTTQVQQMLNDLEDSEGSTSGDSSSSEEVLSSPQYFQVAMMFRIMKIILTILTMAAMLTR